MSARFEFKREMAVQEMLDVIERLEAGDVQQARDYLVLFISDVPKTSILKFLLWGLVSLAKTSGEKTP